MISPTQIDEPDEQLIFSCGYCGVPILTFWVPDGGLLRGEYVLAGDLIFHPRCFDKHYEGWAKEDLQCIQDRFRVSTRANGSS